MINTSKVNGNRGAFLQPVKFGFNETGRYAILRWEGTRNEVMLNASFVEQMGGTWHFEDSYTGGKCVLEGNIPRDLYQGEQPVDVWEFFAQVAEKDILTSDIDAVKNVSSANKDMIRYWLQNPKTPPEAVEDVDFSDNTPGDRAAAFSLYTLMASGVQSIRVNVPTLRNTVTVSTVYAISISLANIGRIYSTRSLFTIDAVPAGTVDVLPNQTSNRTGFVYGWYKKHPTLRRAARQKLQIEREWEYGLWPTLIYGDLL